MKIYIIQTNKKIEPFLEDVSNVLIKNKKLKTLQDEILNDLDIESIFIKDYSEINDENEYIVFEDNIFFEPEILNNFIEESRKLETSTICALKKGIFTLRTIISIQDIKEHDNYIEYNLYYHPQKNLRNEKFKPIIFGPDQELESINLPKHMESSGKYFIPTTTNSIIQINHWSNIWSANLASILSNVARLRKKSKIKLFVLALKSLSFNKWKIANQLNDIGRNCDIHPTAYIEGSIIGDNVVIGAGSVIRESIIEDDSFIGNGVIIETSVIGSNCTILNGHILYSVLYSGVFTVTHMISASLIGKDCFIGSGVVLTDFRLDNKNITVMKDGLKVDTGNIFLGCCLGNNVYLGSGCVIAPGRAIPNNLHISLDKEKIITKIDQDNKILGFQII